jgi:hypothetical protein
MSLRVLYNVVCKRYDVQRSAEREVASSKRLSTLN